jgi:photosystem II stability/assembly factor-like uncharacterized protein
MDRVKTPIEAARVLWQMYALAWFSLSVSSFRDSEAAWTEQSVNSPEHLAVVHAVTAEIVWVVGDQGRVVVTTDGGLNWIPRSVPGAANLRGLFAFGEQTSVVSDQLGRFWRTTDGGVQWVQVHGGTGSSINGIHFFDDQNGWAMGDPVKGRYVILLSSDGGSSWIASPDAPPATGFGTVRSYDWIGTQVGVFSTRGWVIWRTTNAGAQWDSVGMDIHFMGGVELSNLGVGLAAGHSSGGPLLRRSTDSGATWIPSVHPSEATPLRNFDWIEGTSEVWGVTSQTGLFQSTNEGIDWERHTLAPAVEFVAMDIDFLDRDTGWCVGWHTADPGRIFRWSTTTGVPSTPAGVVLPKVTAYPNPFRSEIVIELHRAGSAPAEWSVYDLMGRLIWAVGNTSGIQHHRWDGRDSSGRAVPSGAYFYRVRSGTTESTGRVVKIP